MLTHGNNTVGELPAAWFRHKTRIHYLKLRTTNAYIDLPTHWEHPSTHSLSYVNKGKYM